MFAVATANITIKTVEDIKKRSEIDWVVPISLGDSHKGFRVIGTTNNYFERIRYRRNMTLKFDKGNSFSNLFEAVIGNDVANSLGYNVGDKIILAHGTGDVIFGKDHSDTPFIISGILEKTGTPSDRAVIVSLEAIEAIHIGWNSGTYDKKIKTVKDYKAMNLKPTNVTALFVGLKSRMTTFSFQRWINRYSQEPITAILPGVVFGELWSLIVNIEKALLIVTSMVVFTALLGMIVSILSSLNERRREMAILRSLGAKPIHIFTLFITESSCIAFLGVFSGATAMYALLFTFKPIIEKFTGLYIEITSPGNNEFIIMLIIILASIISGIIPALRAYSLSLSDGLIVKS
jgi:putative ABC transport system permease protein